MEDTAQTIATLAALRARGVHIALDDFGTGYSSLSYLSRMPFTSVKVDRSFISGLREGSDNRAIVRAIIAMAGGLGMSVTAEGVETVEQARMLWNMDCDLFQGHYFSRPMAAEHIPALLASRWILEERGIGTRLLKEILG